MWLGITSTLKALSCIPKPGFSALLEEPPHRHRAGEDFVRDVSSANPAIGMLVATEATSTAVRPTRAGA